MNLPEDTHLAYIVWHEAWYADASRIPGEQPHLMVSAAERGRLSPGVPDRRLRAWQLSRHAGQDVRGRLRRVRADARVLRALAEQGPVTLDAVRGILNGLGAVDETQREVPERYRLSAGRGVRRAHRRDGNGSPVGLRAGR